MYVVFSHTLRCVLHESGGFECCWQVLVTGQAQDSIRKAAGIKVTRPEFRLTRSPPAAGHEDSHSYNAEKTQTMSAMQYRVFSAHFFTRRSTVSSVLRVHCTALYWVLSLIWHYNDFLQFAVLSRALLHSLPVIPSLYPRLEINEHSVIIIFSFKTLILNEVFRNVRIWNVMWVSVGSAHSGSSIISSSSCFHDNAAQHHSPH